MNAYDAATGADIWTFETDDSGLSSPSLSDGVVYVVGESALYAIDVETGAERWTFATLGGSDYGIVASPAVLDGVVYFVGSDGMLYAVAGSESL